MFPEKNLFERFWSVFSLLSGKTALVFEGLEISFAELKTRLAKLLEGFERYDIKTGETLGWVGKNHPSWIELCLACLARGVLFLPLNPRLSGTELARLLEKSKARWLIADCEQLAKFPKPSRKLTIFTIQEGTKEFPLLDQLYFSQPQKPLRTTSSWSDPAILLFTAGTTGKPKGCVRRQRELFHLLSDAVDVFRFSQSDIYLVASSFSHSAPGRFALSHLLAGATVVIMDAFDPEKVLQNIESFRITTIFLVPTQVAAILNLPKNVKSRFNLRTLRAVICAGAPFPPELKRDAISFLGKDVLFEFYGATELATVSVLYPEEQKIKPLSVGKPIKTAEVKILNKQKVPLPPGKIGEVFVKSRALMSYSLEAGTEKTEDGFLSVGDLGFIDEDGYLYLRGRKNNVIISGGLNIQAEEVEKALKKHADIQEAAVVGLPDPYWGEKVAAAIVTRSGKPLRQEELKSFLRKTLASYKIPKAYFFLKQLPKNAAGKVWIRKLKEKLSHTPDG